MKLSALSQNQKYRKVLEVGQKLAVSTNQVGMRDYLEKYSQLESLFDYWQRDIPIVIVPKKDTSLKAQLEDEGVEENLSTKQDEQVAAIQLHNCKEKSEVDKTVSSVSCVGQVATVITAPCINANDHGQGVTSDSLVWDP